MTIIVIGKNSFLAQALSKENSEWIFLTHREIDDNLLRLKNADVIINCAFDKNLTTEPYDINRDIDLKIANIIKGHNVHYVMLSSRMVYGDIAFPFKETDICQPENLYGMAKLQTEKTLSEILSPDKLTILRLSNVFGFEPGRSTFFGMALSTLKAENQIVMNMLPQTRRDFLPAVNFNRLLSRVIHNSPGGIFNLASGIAVSCAEIASWLLEGYGQGKVVFTGDTKKGEFEMDMQKFANAFGATEISVQDIKSEAIECGRKLRYQ